MRALDWQAERTGNRPLIFSLGDYRRISIAPRGTGATSSPSPHSSFRFCSSPARPFLAAPSPPTRSSSAALVGTCRHAEPASASTRPTRPLADQRREAAAGPALPMRQRGARPRAVLAVGGGAEDVEDPTGLSCSLRERTGRIVTS